MNSFFFGLLVCDLERLFAQEHGLAGSGYGTEEAKEYNTGVAFILISLSNNLIALNYLLLLQNFEIIVCFFLACSSVRKEP